MVERVSPPGTEVLGLTSFDAARRALLENPPDAAVVSLTAAHMPWREFQALCASSRPPVPVLYESCIFSSADDAGLQPEADATRFLRTPASREDLKQALDGLLDEARATRVTAVFEAVSG
jgi:hypothetical protein